MSRGKKKIAKIVDMQSMFSDVILTKKDVDLIIKALWMLYDENHDEDIVKIARYLRYLTYVHKSKNNIKK